MTDRNRKSSLLAILMGALLLALALTRPIQARPAPNARPNVMPASVTGTTTLYFPLIRLPLSPSVDLGGVWTSDDAGTAQLAFLPGSSLVHQVTGTALVSATITVTMQIVEDGVCGGGLVYSATLPLPPGAWGQSIPAAAPDCPGIYTTTTTLVHESYAFSLSTQMAVTAAITPTLSTSQGFDRCAPPTVSEMQAWWDLSPYSVANIYLGGVHYFCSGNSQDAFWVNQVAEQGWSFIATWVGPQAPCTSYNYRMSADPAAAYQEGQGEALSAAAAARSFGLFGELTIIYDVEGYSGGASCRNAVQSFLQGWTDQLHALGLKAGGYGSGCSSYLSDWNDNAPPPDQVWIAHWTDSAYNPDATVWGALCVSNSLWANQQRIKQYGAPHSETWGGVSLTVDSSVFDTSVLGWPPGTANAVATGLQVQDIGMWGPAGGWVQIGGRLFRTEDAGSAWVDITPEDFKVLGASFLDEAKGWATGRLEGDRTLRVGYTHDGGTSWSLQTLDPFGALDERGIGAAYIEVLDEVTLWVALRLQSGSSFSLGRLYASTDGGRSWEEREHPLGEPVSFEDPLTGWTSGGPAGNEVYRTSDGGRSWTAVGDGAPAPDSGIPAARLPDGAVRKAFWDDLHAWALVQSGACTGPKNDPVCVQSWRLMGTADGGRTWEEIKLPGAP